MTQACPFFCGFLSSRTLAGGLWLTAHQEPRGGESSAVCARGGDTSSRRWLRCWHPRWTPRTPPYRGQKLGTSTEVGPAEFFELSSDDGRLTGEERPAALLEPLPRGKLQRHAGIGYEIVQSLDVLVLSSLPRICRWLPSRFSKCQRSCMKEFLSVLWSVVLRRWQNSWRKCRRSQCTYLWFSPRRSFRGESFLASSQDRVQQRLVLGFGGGR